MQTSQQSNRVQQTEPRTQQREKGTPGGDQVTLSAQSTQTASQTRQLQDKQANEVSGATSAQTVEQKQVTSPQAVQAAASKSVTKALEAYVQASLV